MLKWMIRIGLILLVVALVSGAFILLAEKAGASLAALPGEGQHLRDSQGMGLGRQLRGRSENTGGSNRYGSTAAPSAACHHT